MITRWVSWAHSFRRGELKELKHRPQLADRGSMRPPADYPQWSGIGARDGSQLQPVNPPVSFHSAPGASGSLRADFSGSFPGLMGMLQRGLGGDREQG